MGNRVQLDEMGKKILSAIRNELYVNMHFMGPALNSLRYEMDLWTKTVGTDAVSIRFNPNYLFQVYLEHPYLLDRTYMHMLMHCLFRHMFYAQAYPDADLWNLCADIAAESVVDGMDYAVIRVVPSDFREECYRKLKEEVGVLTAQRLYRFFSERPRDYELEDRMAAEFGRDDHSFWARMRDQSDPGHPSGENRDRNPDNGADRTGAPSGHPSGENRDRNPDKGADQAGSPSGHPSGENGNRNPDNSADQTGSPAGHPSGENGKRNPDNGAEQKGSQPPALSGREIRDVSEEWKKNAKQVEAALLMSGKHASKDTGSLERLLSLENRKRTSYKEFLKKFAVVREEARVDPDSFDYAFYNYGMEMYGNMPLMEENEFRESSRVQDLAIVIDTSASCQDRLVQQFLNETAAILANESSFFRKTEIHVLECDERVQKDVVIHSPEEMKRYAGGFHVKGGGGTDFRPAFAYVDELIRKGKMRNLKGLMYFTDGFGIYPETPTPYETAFVFWKDEEFNDREVPAWAIRLYLDAPEESLPQEQTSIQEQSAGAETR